MTRSKEPAFRQRLLSGTPLIGTFVKIPHPQIVELLAGTPLDFIILDAEHAAFDVAALDQCLMAARLAGLPALVRAPALGAPMTGLALDMGAAGLVLPHIASVADAEAAVRAALYSGGARGISGSHRAASYGRGDLAAYAREADAGTVIVAQIEDAAALDAITDIAAVERIDCFFVGRADLMLSLGEADMESPAVEVAVAAIEAAVKAVGKPLGAFVGAPGQLAAHLDAGYRFLTAGTDQSMLKAGAQAAVKAARP